MKPTKLLTIVAIALFSLTSISCAGKRQKKKKAPATAGGSETTKGPAPMTDDEKKVQVEAMALMEKVAAAGVQHKDDCEALAGAWEKLWDDNKELVARATKIDTDPQKVAEWEAAHKDQKKAINAKLKPAFDKCSKNKRIVALLDRMRPKPGAKPVKPATAPGPTAPDKPTTPPAKPK